MAQAAFAQEVEAQPNTEKLDYFTQQEIKRNLDNDIRDLLSTQIKLKKIYNRIGTRNAGYEENLSSPRLNHSLEDHAKDGVGLGTANLGLVDHLISFLEAYVAGELYILDPRYKDEVNTELAAQANCGSAITPSWRAQQEAIKILGFICPVNDETIGDLDPEAKIYTLSVMNAAYNSQKPLDRRKHCGKVRDLTVDRVNEVLQKIIHEEPTDPHHSRLKLTMDKPVKQEPQKNISPAVEKLEVKI